MEVICINDKFSPEWDLYFKNHGIVKPVVDKMYGVREIVPNTKGEKGLLLVEIVNKPTPRISPLTGMRGLAEQNWAISRFTTLMGQPITKETISELIKQSINMSFLKKVASAFVEVDEKPSQKKVALSSTTKVQKLVQVVTPIQSSEFEAFRQQFANILANENKRNYPGNDYFEFVVMKNAMGAIQQEDIRYQAAFAGWMTGGNQTKKSLIDTAGIYLGLVEKEIQQFQEAYQTQYAGQVTKNEQIIASKSADIQKYVELIATLNSDVELLKQENLNNTAKLTVKHDGFMAAGEAQRKEILDEIDKINHYIN